MLGSQHHEGGAEHGVRTGREDLDVRDRALGPLVAPGAKRDDRERPGPALPGVLAALATVAALASRRRTNRTPRRAAAAAAGARAPPSLQPAPI